MVFVNLTSAQSSRETIQATLPKMVKIFGAGGICGAAPEWPPYVYRFENCRNVLVANAGHQYGQRSQLFGDPALWSFILDQRRGAEGSTPGSEYFVLYRR